MEKTISDRLLAMKRLEEDKERLEEEFKNQLMKGEKEALETQEEFASVKAELQKMERKLKMSGEEKHKSEAENEEKMQSIHVEISALSEEKAAILADLETTKQTVQERDAANRELEKEILSLNEREKSQKDLEQQMISYEKELQERLKAAEDQNGDLVRQAEELRKSLEKTRSEKVELAKRNEEEVAKLRSDLEMKMRLERERESSHKELQAQSIEYQKKLQEQLEERERALEEAKAKGKAGMAAHAKEVERLSYRLEEITHGLAVAEEDREELKKRVKEAEEARATMEEKVGVAEASLLEVEKAAAEAGQDHEARVNLLKERHETVMEEFSRKHDTLKNEKVSLHREIETLSEALKTRNDGNVETDALKIKLDIVTKEIVELNLKLEEARAKETSASVRVHELEEELVAAVATADAKDSEISSLGAKIAEQSGELKKQREKIQKDRAEEEEEKADFDGRLKSVIREYEKKLAEVDEAHETELSRLRDEAEAETARATTRFREQVSTLRHDLYEKTTLLEDQEEKHRFELGVRQKELEEEVESCGRVYQAKLTEAEADHKNRCENEILVVIFFSTVHDPCQSTRTRVQSDSLSTCLPSIQY